VTGQFVLVLVDLAIALAQSLTDGSQKQNADVAAILLSVVQKAVQAYEDHTGETLDPSLIRSEAAL